MNYVEILWNYNYICGIILVVKINVNLYTYSIGGEKWKNLKIINR